MTRLLVSVRSAAEARDALAGGADLIDVKEPSRGSLGRAEPAVWREAVAAVAGQRPVSVALGELVDLGSAAARRGLGFLGTRGGETPRLPLAGVPFAKVGLAGCAALPDWKARWRGIVQSLPPGVGAVAVSYADWRTASAPPHEEVIATGAELGCAAWLIDTCDKRGGGLLDHLSIDRLAALIAAARNHGMICVLGGSLTREDAPRLAPLAPDYLAIRGAACREGRTGPLDPDRVRQFAAALRSRPNKPPRQQSPSDPS